MGQVERESRSEGTLEVVGPKEIEAWRVIYANRIHDIVPELRRAAFQQVVICDLALDGLKYRMGESLPSEQTRSIPEHIVKNMLAGVRLDALEQAADLCDQNLDAFSGDECTYRCDVAQAIRALKNAAGQASGEQSPHFARGQENKPAPAAPFPETAGSRLADAINEEPK